MNQNLIRQTNVADPDKKQSSFYKPILFGALTVVSAAMSGHFYQSYLENGGNILVLLVSLSASWRILLSLAAFGVTSLLLVFFTKNIAQRFLVLILETFAFLGFFYKNSLAILGIATGIAFVFVLWGEIVGRNELNENLEIRFFKVARPILVKFTTALTLMLVILYIPRIEQNGLFIPKENFKIFYNWAAKGVGNFYPEINFTSSFDKFTESIAALELRNNPTFRNLPPPDQKNLISVTAAELTQSLGKNLDVVVSDKDSVSGVFYDFLLKLLNGWRSRFGNWFLASWVFILFLIIRSFGIVFYWAVGFISFIIYQIFLATGFMRIVEIPMPHEVLEF